MTPKTFQLLFRRFGYDLVKAGTPRCDFDDEQFRLSDFEPLHHEIIAKVRPYTITSPERLYSLIESVRYVLKNSIPGALLECGVYKGGSMMAVALALLAEDVLDRDLYLFDTFEGMPEPTEKDIDITGKPAMADFSKMRISKTSSKWVNSSIDNVKRAMALTGYPPERIHYIKGLVEDTIPGEAPESIALLRLDTDWYQSTLHELKHLFPRLETKGLLIVDDYGHFKGAREAVDEYFSMSGTVHFLHRIDYTARLVIKG